MLVINVEQGPETELFTPMVVVPSRNVRMPGKPLGIPQAVNVTDCPEKEGLRLEVSASFQTVCVRAEDVLAA
jgi:hypothetical protein